MLGCVDVVVRYWPIGLWVASVCLSATYNHSFHVAFWAIGIHAYRASGHSKKLRKYYNSIIDSLSRVCLI